MNFRFFAALTLLLTLCLPGISKNHPGSEESKIKTRTIQVKPILKLKDLKINTKGISPIHDSFFDIDENGNYYFLEMINHRILKYSPKKEFICQIGSIGQADEDLYFPSAIKVDGNSILVAHREGKKLKRFSLSGQFISAFDIKDCIHMNTIRVHNGSIYCDARYEADDWYKRNAISVFNSKGEYIKGIGKNLKTQDWVSYRIFNAAFFQVKNNHIYGTFKCYPVIFKYDLNGRTIFYKDLGKMNIPEIDEINNRVNQGEFDTPEKRKSSQPNVIRGTQYCIGFDVSENNHIYYSLVSFPGFNSILHFDSNGNLLEKLILEKGDRPIKIRGIHIKKSVKYGIGYYKNFRDEVFLFVF
jgi:hypothetical protein